MSTNFRKIKKKIQKRRHTPLFAERKISCRCRQKKYGAPPPPHVFGRRAADGENLTAHSSKTGPPGRVSFKFQLSVGS